MKKGVAGSFTGPYSAFSQLLCRETAHASWKHAYSPVQARVHQTGQTGPARFRFGPVPNRLKFKIQNWIKKMKNLQILQGAMNLMVSNFLKNSFI